MEETEVFDYEDFYDEQIRPRLAQVMALCQERNLPFAACVIYSQDADNMMGYGALVADTRGRCAIKPLVYSYETLGGGR